MMNNPNTATDLVPEMVKAANSAHMYKVTEGLYDVKFIAIRPKTAEIYILK